jgi:RNA polymerase sigma-70 factor, ECF subfamily
MVPIKQNRIFEDDVSNEVELIEKAQADPNAFAELYQRYLDRIYLYLRTRVASEEDAADLTQQVFLQALKALPGYRQRGLPFAAWLFHIARNVVTDSYRRRRNIIPWEDVHPRSLVLFEQDVEDNVLHQENIALLRKLLAQLDASKRELLALRFAAGLTTRQIAAILGRNHDAVRKDLARILQRLKEHYNEQ